MFRFSIDEGHASLPAAGYRNGTTLYNAGSNGNYWSSTPYNSQNAYKLNFNSSERNYDNNNNRKYGQSVRAVSELTKMNIMSSLSPFKLTREQLLQDLYKAYFDARKNKRSRIYQLQFEYRLEDNLVKLRDELWENEYKIGSSKCFVIHDPKMREIFAASFRDRIVHHLFYNYTHELFEYSFIYDSYSCIKGKGTHFGIKRLEHHIRSVSKGYSKPCYILKLDIRGYFMSINRSILLSLCREIITKYRLRLNKKNKKVYAEYLDFEFINRLLEILVTSNPLLNCKMIGDVSEWKNLPKEKSLFGSANGCGLPIGNLTSQLFSNVYLNKFDQFVKRELKCKNYGRYVDDAFIVSDSKDYLECIIEEIVQFLHESLNLKLNINKTRIYNAYHGVPFLGSYLLPFRRYMENGTLRRIKRKLANLNYKDSFHLQSQLNSYLGVLSHNRCYCMRRYLFGFKYDFSRFGELSNDYLRFYPYD